MIMAELNSEGNRILLTFPYQREHVAAAKRVPGARWVPIEKGGPHWQYPLELTCARQLRKEFPQMALGRKLKLWGQRAVNEERQLRSLAMASSAELHVLPKVLPEFFEWISGRPYQTADVAFMADTSNPLNANAPGGGKTGETIASIFEAELDQGPHLITAPVSALWTVWEEQLRRHQPHPVLVTSYAGRDATPTYAEAERLAGLGKPFWLVTNPYAVMLHRDKRGIEDDRLKAAALERVVWNSVVVDEFHKCGLGNRHSLTRQGLKRLRVQKRIALSGTPIGGKANKLWSILNYLEPESFPSYWRWAENWLVISDNGYGKVVEDIKPGLEEKFYSAHARYMVRRTKREMRKDIPGKQRIDVWCQMGAAQKNQYLAFEKEAEVKIEDEQLSAVGVLAQYTRLRQFAIAKLTIESFDDGHIKVKPTTDSCKLEQLLDKLGDHGITGHKDDDSKEQAIVFSQFSTVIDMVAEALRARNISVGTLTGGTPPAERAALQRGFEARQGPTVLAMTTTAGGVAITLNASDSIHFMDETFNPDDQEQAEDRNRENTAVIYYYRTKDTIEEAVLGINIEKGKVNRAVLDLHRQRMLKLRKRVENQKTRK